MRTRRAQHAALLGGGACLLAVSLGCGFGASDEDPAEQPPSSGESSAVDEPAEPEPISVHDAALVEDLRRLVPQLWEAARYDPVRLPEQRDPVVEAYRGAVGRSTPPSGVGRLEIDFGTDGLFVEVHEPTGHLYVVGGWDLGREAGASTYDEVTPPEPYVRLIDRITEGIRDRGCRFEPPPDDMENARSRAQQLVDECARYQGALSRGHRIQLSTPYVDTPEGVRLNATGFLVFRSGGATFTELRGFCEPRHCGATSTY